MLDLKSSIAALSAAVSAAFASANPKGLFPLGELPAPKQTYRGPTPTKRTRIKGKKGNSGDKLARKAEKNMVGKAYLR